MSAEHPFVTWLVKEHGTEQSPTGEVARLLQKTGPVLPTWGRVVLRHLLYDLRPKRGALTAFDRAWKTWEASTSPQRPIAGGVSQ